MLSALIETATLDASGIAVFSSGRKLAFGKRMIVAECKIIDISVLESAKGVTT